MALSLVENSGQDAYAVGYRHVFEVRSCDPWPYLSDYQLDRSCFIHEFEGANGMRTGCSDPCWVQVSLTVTS